MEGGHILTKQINEIQNTVGNILGRICSTACISSHEQQSEGGKRR